MPGSGNYRLYFESSLPGNRQRINQQLWEQYSVACNRPDIKRTHYFSGRYENIYIDTEHIPALEAVLEAARRQAGRLLSRPATDLSIGFWFNEMRAGHITLPHRHDEDNELLSAVYYIRVPECSGDLVLTAGRERKTITPREGMLVYFAPDVLHEVTENRSASTRLSIGMNFGVRTKQDKSPPAPERP